LTVPLGSHPKHIHLHYAVKLYDIQEGKKKQVSGIVAKVVMPEHVFGLSPGQLFSLSGEPVSHAVSEPLLKPLRFRLRQAVRFRINFETMNHKVFGRMSVTKDRPIARTLKD
jgi:hypothetical protein